MPLKLNKFIAPLLLIVLVGCKDRYQEGFQKGFKDGFDQATAITETICSEKIEKEKRSCAATSAYPSTFESYSTEVCGGGGVNLNGKYHSGGKKGCVRVFSDGRVERY